MCAQVASFLPFVRCRVSRRWGWMSIMRGGGRKCVKDPQYLACFPFFSTLVLDHTVFFSLAGE